MAIVKRGIGIVHALTSNFAEGRLVGGFFRASSERDPPALSQGAERFFIKEIGFSALCRASRVGTSAPCQPVGLSAAMTDDSREIFPANSARLVRFSHHGLLNKDVRLEIQEGYSRANDYRSL